MSTALGTQWANALRAMAAGARKQHRDAPSWFDVELGWYVNEREGELGLRGVPIEMGIGGDPEVHDGVSDHQVRAATRARHIETALERLHPNDRLLLLAVHFRISPRAHKDRHSAQEKCIEARADQILTAVSIFRGAWAARRGC